MILKDELTLERRQDQTGRQVEESVILGGGGRILVAKKPCK